MAPNMVRRLARSLFVNVTPETSVQEVADEMANTRTDAAIVLRRKKVVGIFTVKDLITRVIALRRCLKSTKMANVMSSPVSVIVQRNLPGESAPIEGRDHISYLPVVDEGGGLVAVVSGLDLLRNSVKDLSHTNEVLAAYVSADGIGG